MSKRIKELADQIIKARDAYYNKQPSVSDAVFDAWVDELTRLDPNHPAVTNVGAPVAVNEWKKVRHTVPMSSLNKVNTPDELKKWAQEADTNAFLLCDKLDGISISTTWKDGRLHQAVTRGNGEVGEDITSNVLKMEGIPKKLKKEFSGNLRGEIVLRKSIWKKHFSNMANPRNAASGLAKRFDGDGVEHLTVMMYQISSGKDFKTEEEQFKYLKQLGVLVPKYSAHKSIDGVIGVYDDYQKHIRESLDYDIDGLVVRVDDLADQFSLGEKHHRPKGQTAFKFDAEGRETTLRNIVWQTGNTGRITPVAEFDTIELAGANVSRASLYNIAYIKELMVDINAKVLVTRNNDVIPCVRELIKGTGTVARAPAKCPACGSSTLMNGEYLQCTNRVDCPAQIIGKIKIWIKEQNILEWGDKVLQRLIDKGIIEDVADLYCIHQDELADIDRMGKRSAAKLIKIMHEHKQLPLENLIGGLGIISIGTRSVKKIVKEGHDTLEKLQKLTVSDVEKIEGFGEITAQAFVDGLKENKKRIDDLFAAGISVKARPKGTLTSKSFCFTGAMQHGRKELHALVERHGGTVETRVKKDLNYLVIDDPQSTSSNAKGARKLGTKCISEQEFLDMIG